MAKATKQDNEVTLTLTSDEAATLMYVAGCGKAYGGGQHDVALGEVYHSLQAADVEDLYSEHGYSLFAGDSLVIRFK